MNPETDLCAGCYRTLDEIASWTDYTHDRKVRVLSAIQARRLQFPPDPTPPPGPRE